MIDVLRVGEWLCLCSESVLKLVTVWLQLNSTLWICLRKHVRWDIDSEQDHDLYLISAALFYNVIRVFSASVGLNLMMELNFSVIAPNIKGGRNTLYKQMHMLFLFWLVLLWHQQKRHVNITSRMICHFETQIGVLNRLSWCHVCFCYQCIFHIRLSGINYQCKKMLVMVYKLVLSSCFSNTSMGQI